MTRIAVFVAAWAMAAGMAFATPRVGTSVALCGPKYPGDEIFKERPVCAEYERHGLDMHVMTPLKKGEDVLRRFHDFHVVWLMVEHEAYPNLRGNVLDPDVVGEALKAYVAAGGGLVIQHSPGRYPEAGADKYWDTAFAHLGMTRLHEEIVDLANATNWGRRMIFHTDRLKPHPVTDGVPGLWLAARNDVRTGHGGTWGTHAIVYSPEWETVVETAPTAKSYCKDKDTNALDYGCVGRFTAGGPVVAVRTLGKGRVVSIGIHKDNGAWMYGIDTWPNVTERGEVCGRRTDTVKLVENALKWAAEPAEAIAGFTDGAKPFLRNAEPYVMSPELGNLPPENRRWKSGAPWKFPKGVEGVIGLHSSLSDGESSVAEYAAEARRLGLGFIVFTDPLAALGDDAKLKRLREECAAASSEDLYVCPSVEYVDLDGLEWMQHHERVAFPDPKPLKLDGGTYERFKNGVVTQRNNYGGHQNLYRGAIINTERLAEAGVHPVNLAYFNGAIPRAYEVDRLVHDNERTVLLQPSEHALPIMRADYQAMRQMIYGDYPSFGALLETLAAIEADVNALC